MSDFISESPRGTPGRQSAEQWERSVLEKMAMGVVAERRQARRWGIFFKFIVLAYVSAAAWFLLGSSDFFGAREVAGNHTAIVKISGVIKADGQNSADRINRALRAAFASAQTTGVILRINSPGGSPVQSGLIFNEIKRLRAKYEKIPLYAVVEEICASGGYFVASAADKIFVDRASLIGSIGVLMDGFGFVGTMHKLGVERRLFTAGADKGFLDPFSPLSASQRNHVQGLLDEIHGQFIESVRQGRGDRLQKDAELFSGLIWTGARSIKLGLADELGSVSHVAREVIKAEDVVDFSVQDSIVERIAKRFGVSFGGSFLNGLASVIDGPELR